MWEYKKNVAVHFTYVKLMSNQCETFSMVLRMETKTVVVEIRKFHRI